MTHGTFAHNRMRLMTDLQHLLGTRGISTLAITLSLGIDMRRGMYDVDHPHHHKHTDSLDEIDAWLSWLREAGAKNNVLLGHSRGGNQTAWFAAERLEGKDVKAIALLAPMTWSDTRSHEFYRRQHGMDITPVLERAQALSSDQMLENIPYLFYPNSSASAGSYLSYHGEDPRLNTPYLMPKISQPLLVLAAEADEIFDDLPVKVNELACSNLQFNVIPGADHFFKGQFGVAAANTVADFIESVE